MKGQRIQKRFLETLSEVANVSYACKKHGISRQTYYRWRAREEYFAILADAAFLSGEEAVNDMAEMGALKKVEQGDWRAIQYWLSRRHPKFKQPPWRGYGNQQEPEEDPIRLAAQRRKAKEKVEEWVKEWEGERKENLRKVEEAREEKPSWKKGGEKLR